MGPGQIRSDRINTLYKLFLRVHKETKNTQKAYDAMMDRAYGMASKKTAEEYKEEVLRMVGK
jgi:hypothetical protein